MVLNGTLKQFPNGFWSVPENYDYAVKCMRYLIEHVLKWDEEQVKKNYSKEMLQKYKLRGMVQVLFPHSIYDALDNAYRGKYKPWELNKVGFVWDEDKIIEATKWLVEEKLKLDIYNLENELYITHFEDNGMASVVQGKIKYNASSNGLYKLISMAYPKIYKEDTCRKNIKKRVGNELNTRSVIKMNNNDGIVSEKEVLDTYKKVLRDINEVFPSGYWKGKNARVRARYCVRYAVEHELKVDVEQLKDILRDKNKNGKFARLNRIGISKQVMLKLRLRAMIEKVYDFNYINALVDAFILE